ncbi:MAG: OmpH family outer membrane protein [Nitrospirae bacterium]|nr:MAG: OmpH family outer membrane protein [Nitrospirota bacterium]
MELEVGNRSGRVKQADVLVSRVAAMALLFLVGGCATTSSTQGSVRLGVVDSQKVLNETDAGKKAMGSLNSFMKVVAKVAQQMGLLVVIERGRAGSTVYNDSSLDLSARVIEEFGKEAH